MLINPTLKQKEIIEKNVSLAKAINELDCALRPKRKVYRFPS